MYWNLPYPYRNSDIGINIDEAGIFLETVNRKIGKAFIGKKVRANVATVTQQNGHSSWAFPVDPITIVGSTFYKKLARQF
jgi:hypothetical protein